MTSKYKYTQTLPKTLEDRVWVPKGLDLEVWFIFHCKGLNMMQKYGTRLYKSRWKRSKKIRLFVYPLFFP